MSTPESLTGTLDAATRENPRSGTATEPRAAGGCAACGGPTARERPGPPPTVRCPCCGLLALESPPGPEECAAYYQEDYYSSGTGARFLSLFELPFHLFRWLRFRSIARRASRVSAILDVGCGRGDLLETFKKAGWEVLGTQLSETAARAARTLRGVDVVCGELPALELPAGHFGVITFFHVLEHLPRPGIYLDRARELLADDGLLVIEVPDCSSPGFRFLVERSFCFDYPHHLLFFSPASLRALLERHGFEVTGRSGFSLEYSPFTTLQNLLNLLPGQPGRLYRSLMRNAGARALRSSPWTWLHAALGVALAPLAFLISLAGLVAPCGNTVRFYCRKRPGNQAH